MHTAELIALPLSGRLLAMEALWESLCQDPTQAQMVPAWHQDELNSRLAALDSGEETAAPWGEAKERSRQRAKQMI